MRNQDEQFDAWVECAAERYEVLLMDGRQAVLQAVRQNAMSCKVFLDGRYYNCWVDDIALLRKPMRMRRKEVNPSGWFLLQPWQAPVLEESPGSKPRLLRDRASKHWLTVTPKPGLLHPSFQPR